MMPWITLVHDIQVEQDLVASMRPRHDAVDHLEASGKGARL